MVKVLFVCHGNICRSPMGACIFAELARRRGVSDHYEIDSAATSLEEIGNEMYPPAERKLREKERSGSLVDLTGNSDCVYQKPLAPGMFHAGKVPKPYVTWQDDKNTKGVFGVDTGLLAAQSALPARAVLDGNAVFTHFKGALAEQFVQQELRAAAGDEPATWMPSNSTAEIDFLIQDDDGIVPVEVKAERNLKAKSLAVYRAAHSPSLAIRTSLAPHLFSEGLLDLPLPAIGAWRRYARRRLESTKI